MKYSSNWYLVLAGVTIAISAVCAVAGGFAFVDFIHLVF